MSEPDFISADIGDLTEISEFVREQNAETRTTASYLEWWFFQNPTRAFSLLFLRRGADVVAIASMNTVKIALAGKDRLAAMPQKVLTAEALRGGGIFGRLYRKSEGDALAKGADLFLTFTNAASTPIFLARFSYMRGLCPDLVMLPSQAWRVLSRPRYAVVEKVPETFFDASIYSPDNAIQKSREYLRWRYGIFESGQYDVLEVVSGSRSVAGYVVLKKTRKKGLPFYLLMDVVARQREDLALLVDQAALYSTRKRALALLYLDFAEIGAVCRTRVHLRIRNRFNFLVKGKNEAETRSLSTVPFTFSFGDFDFS